MNEKKFVNAKVNGRERKGSKRRDRQETGHSRRKNKVGTPQHTNLERRSERGRTPVHVPGDSTPRLHLTRSSENQLNALRIPRYGSTCGTGTEQTRRGARKKKETAKQSGGVRLWGYPIDCGRANNSGRSHSQSACGFVESCPRS